MCDTLYRKTNYGMLFGKNSDRSPNEPNLMMFYEAKHQDEKSLKCTYITIDEVAYSNAILMMQPSWMFGGEMGINDHGVVIGNEAVFTKTKGKKDNRLLGMDLLRLGLMRGNSAFQALEIIIGLLEKYGQGGNCGFDKRFYYDNSFLIADHKEAYVLETAGINWIYYKVENSYNISNRLSINDKFTKSSVEMKNFAKTHSDWLFTHFSGSLIRQTDASFLMNKPEFGVVEMMETLRHHHNEKDSSQNLYRKGSVKSLCMHKSMLGDHTTSSMIISSNIDHINTIWMTGSSTPCLSIYKPIYFFDTVSFGYKKELDSLNYWLDREYIIRAIYANIIDESEYKEKLQVIQTSFIEEERKLFQNNPSKEVLFAFSNQCLKIEQDFIDSYKEVRELVKENIHQLPKIWQKYTKNLGLNVFDFKTRK